MALSLYYRDDWCVVRELPIGVAGVVLAAIFAAAMSSLDSSMATYPIKSLWDVFLALLGLLGSGLAGVFALGIFTRRANSTGAIVAVVCSTAILFYVQRFTKVHFFLYGGIGIITCFSLGYLASVLVPLPKSQSNV